MGYQGFGCAWFSHSILCFFFSICIFGCVFFSLFSSPFLEGQNLVFFLGGGWCFSVNLVVLLGAENSLNLSACGLHLFMSQQGLQVMQGFLSSVGCMLVDHRFRCAWTGD